MTTTTFTNEGNSLHHSSSKVNLLDLAASTLAATVAAARPIRDLSRLGTTTAAAAASNKNNTTTTTNDANARLKGDGSIVTDADFSAQGAIMRTIQQHVVSANDIRIVGEESEEEMWAHLHSHHGNTTTSDEEEEPQEEEERIYELAKQEVYMRYYKFDSGRPPPLSSLAQAVEDDDQQQRRRPIPLSSSSQDEQSQQDDDDVADDDKYIVNADRVSVFVDPLDGTKSYARADYESVTVLIAIILDNTPCFGVICKPFGCGDCPLILNTGCMAVYGGTLLNGVYVGGGGQCHKPTRQEGALPRAVISQSRSEGIVSDFCTELAASHVIHPEPVLVAGAGEKSLRLVMGTENEALWFFPKAGTSRWDVAASDALLRQLGGKLTDKFGNELDYSKSREDAENTDGIVASNCAALHEQCIQLFQGRSWEDR